MSSPGPSQIGWPAAPTDDSVWGNLSAINSRMGMPVLRGPTPLGRRDSITSITRMSMPPRASSSQGVRPQAVPFSTIAEDVRAALKRYIAEFGLETCHAELNLEHVCMAAMLDSLWHHYFKKNIYFLKNADDSIFKNTFEKIHELVIKGNTHLERMKERLSLEKFNPNVAATLKIILSDFEKYPPLKAIPIEKRCCLIIEPGKIKKLHEEYGISPSPLLAFIFDTEEGYARSVAKRWIAAMEIAFNSYIDTSQAKNFFELSYKEIAEESMEFSTSFSNINNCDFYRIAGNIANLVIMGISSGIMINQRLCLEQTLDGAVQFFEDHRGRSIILNKDYCLVNLLDDFLIKVESELRHFKIANFLFVRNIASKELLTLAIQRALDSYLKSRGRAETLERAVNFYHAVEFAHVFEDGNCRFAQQVMNVLLVREGKPLALFMQPNIVDVASTQDAVRMLREGQLYLHKEVKEINNRLPAKSSTRSRGLSLEQQLRETRFF
jgi:prophage maintenance system killer protein